MCRLIFFLAIIMGDRLSKVSILAKGGRRNKVCDRLHTELRISLALVNPASASCAEDRSWLALLPRS